MNKVIQPEIIATPSQSITDKKSITIGAIVQVMFTLISRIFGMVRDVMVSHIFGAGAITDAYLIALTIPNVLRQFLGEGAFSVAFVPIYLSTKEKAGSDAARTFFRDAFGLLLITLTVLVVLGVLFSQGLVHLFAYGFADHSEQLHLTNVMTKWMFPYIFMISLVALFGAYLACYKRFAAMASAPILLNSTQIIAMVLWIDYFSPPIMVLAASILLGGLLQVALMVTALMRAGLWALPRFSLKSDAMKNLLKLLGPALFGVFVYQLNIIVLRQLASFLGEGQITYYYNADRLAQFATGVFAVSIATAALPELSKGMAKFGTTAFHDTLRFTMTITSFIMTPCAFGLLVFAYPVISVIFVHGAFTDHDALITANALMAFSPSLIAFGLSRPLIQAFYTLSDTLTPVLVGIVTVVLNFRPRIIVASFRRGWFIINLVLIEFCSVFSLAYFVQEKEQLFIFSQVMALIFISCGYSSTCLRSRFIDSPLG